MKKLFVLVGVLLIAASKLTAQDLNLEQILEKHYKAAGLDNLQNVKTIIISGTITTNVIMPIKYFKVRPNKYRMERDVADITGLWIFDGQNGWTTAPWTDNPNPQVATGAALTDLQLQADFDGSIYNWKAKGHKAELVGVEKSDGSNVYRIKLIRNDGGIEYYLINANSFLLLKKISYKNNQGKNVEVENVFSDYRCIAGVMFAFDIVSNLDGQPSSEIIYETVDLNQPVDDEIFVMPTN